jgi:hypothetical protein
MDNDVFDDDDLPDDFDEMDYMISDEWNTEIDDQFSIFFFKDVLGKLKTIDSQFYENSISCLQKEELTKLEDLINEFNIKQTDREAKKLLRDSEELLI